MRDVLRLCVPFLWMAFSVAGERLHHGARAGNRDRATALSVQEAEEVFQAWRQRLKTSTTSSVNASSSVGNGKSTRGLPGSMAGRFVKALSKASVATPAMAACMSMNVDLAQLGAPGVTVAVGLQGEIDISPCTECFQWAVNAELAFEWGATLFGKGLKVGFNVGGDVHLRELTCQEAPDSAYCRFLQIFLPPEEEALSSSRLTCHSDSPFDSLTAFITYQWRRLKAVAQGDKATFVNKLALDLHEVEEGLGSYLPVMQAPPPEKPSQQLNRTFVVECVRGGGFRKADFVSKNDPLCQVEVAPALSTEDENYRRYWAGVGPRADKQCDYDFKAAQCAHPDRCLYNPSSWKCEMAPRSGQ